VQKDNFMQGPGKNSRRSDFETFFFLESKRQKAKRKIPVITPTSHVITNRNTIGAQLDLTALC
jgi:hypothetical protein